jgi:hypothetical protein
MADQPTLLAVRSSAKADLEHPTEVGLQRVGYLPFSPKGLGR